MEVEYDLTRDDLYAFQWRAVYLLWLPALVLIAIVPAIGSGGFVISRVSFTFLIVAVPIVFLAQWLLDTRLMRRTILGLVAEEKPPPT